MPPNCIQSMRQPKATEQTMMEVRYMHSVRIPSTFLTTRMDAMLHAGPAISSTMAAPGVSPFSIRATAMGIEPVAHRYIGMDMASTSSIEASVLSRKSVKALSGKASVITAATTMPTTSHLPMSSIISTKA